MNELFYWFRPREKQTIAFDWILRTHINYNTPAIYLSEGIYARTFKHRKYLLSISNLHATVKVPVGRNARPLNDEVQYSSSRKRRTEKKYFRSNNVCTYISVVHLSHVERIDSLKMEYWQNSADETWIETKRPHSFTTN